MYLPIIISLIWLAKNSRKAYNKKHRIPSETVSVFENKAELGFFEYLLIHFRLAVMGRKPKKNHFLYILKILGKEGFYEHYSCFHERIFKLLMSSKEPSAYFVMAVFVANTKHLFWEKAIRHLNEDLAYFRSDERVLTIIFRVFDYKSSSLVHSFQKAHESKNLGLQKFSCFFDVFLQYRRANPNNYYGNCFIHGYLSELIDLANHNHKYLDMFFDRLKNDNDVLDIDSSSEFVYICQSLMEQSETNEKLLSKVTSEMSTSELKYLKLLLSMSGWLKSEMLLPMLFGLLEHDDKEIKEEASSQIYEIIMRLYFFGSHDVFAFSNDIKRALNNYVLCGNKEQFLTASLILDYETQFFSQEYFHEAYSEILS